MIPNKLLLGFSHQRGSSAFATDSYSSGVSFSDVANLFEVDADVAPVYTEYGGELQRIDGKQAIVNSDSGDVWNVVSTNYSIHQYSDILLRSAQNLLSVNPGELEISAAGLADNGGVGFIQIQLPTSSVLEADTVRPTLTIATSHTGRFATQFKLGLDRLYCLNQLGMVSSTRTGTGRIAFRHTSNSHLNMDMARDTLRVMVLEGMDYATAVQRLMDTPFTHQQMGSLIRYMAPEPKAKPDRDEPHGAALTRWQNKVDNLWNIYSNDYRVMEWKDTAWGAYQTFSTYRLWASSVREYESTTDRFNRNMMSYIGGTTDAYDHRVLTAINELI